LSPNERDIALDEDPSQTSYTKQSEMENILY